VKNIDENQKLMVDAYFEETTDEKMQMLKGASYKKLSSSLSALDVFDESVIEVPSDFFPLILQVEKEQEKRAEKREMAIFVASAFSILLLAFTGVIIFDSGIKLLIVFEVFVSVMLPLSLIPFSRNILKRSDVQ
jgi:hypothetical protein